MAKPNADTLAAAKLKPVAEKKDASAPAIDGTFESLVLIELTELHAAHLKTDLTKGKKDKEALKGEIAAGKQLKHVKTRDASAPLLEGVVLHLPDKAKVEDIIKQLWNKDNRRAWFVLLFAGVRRTRLCHSLDICAGSS